MVNSANNKAKNMIKVIAPILITQVSMYLITFFDILMTGRYDTQHLGGVTIGSSFWVPIYTGLAGILLALTPIIAQQFGANDKKHIRPFIQQGLYLSILLAAIVFTLISMVVDPILFSMPLEQQVQSVASNYLIGMSYGLVPLFGFAVLRSFFDGLGETRVSMAIILLSAPINIFMNYLFIYGKFGFPELGGVGAGYASAITYWLVFFIACATATKFGPFTAFELFKRWTKVNFQKWKEILTIGLPMGFSIFVEISIFSIVTLLMANYTTETISAHQIALNFTSLLYMLPLSMSMGVTILVGQEVGAKKFKEAKQYGYFSIIATICFSFIAIAILLGFREQIASLYSTDEQIITLATSFFIYAAFFQLSDAIQAPVQGILRGYKDVNITFIMAIISYWVIGLPVGYMMANYTQFGPYGYWIGLIAGLTVGAISLTIRLVSIQRQAENTQ